MQIRVLVLWFILCLGSAYTVTLYCFFVSFNCLFKFVKCQRDKRECFNKLFSLRKKKKRILKFTSPHFGILVQSLLNLQKIGFLVFKKQNMLDFLFLVDVDCIRL